MSTLVSKFNIDFLNELMVQARPGSIPSVYCTRRCTSSSLLAVSAAQASVARRPSDSPSPTNNPITSRQALTEAETTYQVGEIRSSQRHPKEAEGEEGVGRRETGLG